MSCLSFLWFHNRIPFEKKLVFTEKLQGLNPSNLTKFIKKVKEVCPYVLEDVEDHRMHVRIDDISKVQLQIFEDFVDRELLHNLLKRDA